MKQSNCKKIFRIVGALVLSLCVLCMAFIAGNQAVFANANVVPEDYPNPEFMVLPMRSVRRNAPGPSAAALSIYDAAAIGSQYIWEMFGESTDGSTIVMAYAVNPFGTRPRLGGGYETRAVRNHWAGYVFDSYRQIGAGNSGYSFSFRLDAVSGMRIGISDERTSHSEHLPVLTLAPGQRTRNLPRNTDPYYEIANEIASLHFNQSEIECIRFGMRAPNFADVARGRGNSFREFVLHFSVIDCTGRTARVVFTEDGRLISICSKLSDISPGGTHIQFWTDEDIVEKPPGFIESLVEVNLADLPPGVGWQNMETNFFMPFID